MSRWEQAGRVERIAEQEKNTHVAGTYQNGVEGYACCKPVMLAWFLGDTLRVGERHVGSVCVGEMYLVDPGYFRVRGRRRAPRPGSR